MTPEHDESPLFCDRCSRQLRLGRGEFYVVRIEAIADPTPPEFTDEDLARDHREEFARLCEALQHLSAREAMDQVYRQVTLYLCNACYRPWIENPTG